MQSQRSELPHIAADILERVRRQRPRVHCITNAVAQNFTANVLLAAGAIPSMTISADEIADFVARADALLVNLGTMNSERREAIGMAIAVAASAGTPWVLDPVFIDRSGPRAAFTQELMVPAPQAIRLNGAEFATLAGVAAEPRAVADFARAKGTAIGLTGATDLIADGTRLVTLANGHPFMARVTAMGCAESALVAACLAVESDAWKATAAAIMSLGVAGEVAAERARGVGSFAVEIVDAIDGLDRDTLVARARVR